MTSMFQRFSSSLSAVHRGSAFELRSLDMLQNRLSMSLTRVGGKSDGGIDLQGWWWVPETRTDKPTRSQQKSLWRSPDGILRRRIRVLAQCKAEKRKASPVYIRELEGVVAMAQQQSSTESAKENVATVGMLISQSPFTRATVLRTFSSTLPLFLLHLPPESKEEYQEAMDADDSEGDHEGLTDMGAAIWNIALARDLLNGKVELRWERSIETLATRPGIWYRGNKVDSYFPSDELSEIDQ